MKKKYKTIYENKDIPGAAYNLIMDIAWHQENAACNLSKEVACSPEEVVAGNPILEGACNLMEAACSLLKAADSL